MLEEMNVEPNLPSVSNLSDEQRAIAYSREEMEEESEWEDEEAEKCKLQYTALFVMKMHKKCVLRLLIYLPSGLFSK